MPTGISLTHADLVRLQPYVRLAREDVRPAWAIRQRRILDYLLVCIAQGTGRFSVEGTEFPVGPGDVVWIPPGALHSMEGFAPRMRVLYIHFDLCYDPGRSPMTPITTAGMDDLSRLQRWLHPPLGIPAIEGWSGKLPVVNATAIGDVAKGIIAESLGGRHPLLLASGILRLLVHIERGLSPVAHGNAHWSAMQSRAEEIRNAPELRLRVGVLAAKSGLSASRFRQVFLAVHGETPRAMHGRARIQKARDLMLHSGSLATLTSIATALRFSSVHSFSRAFKRVCGLGPLAYLQQHRERIAAAAR